MLMSGAANYELSPWPHWKHVYISDVAVGIVTPRIILPDLKCPQYKHDYPVFTAAVNQIYVYVCVYVCICIFVYIYVYI